MEPPRMTWARPIISGRRVTDGLDVVAVGVEHERAVVVRVVDLTHARLAVVGAARRQGGRVEGVDGLAVLDPEGHVDAALRSAVALADPEEGEVVAEAAHGRYRLHHQLHREGGAGLLVERLAGFVVAHIQADVVEPRHRYLLGRWGR